MEEWLKQILEYTNFQIIHGWFLKEPRGAESFRKKKRITKETVCEISEEIFGKLYKNSYLFQ